MGWSQFPLPDRSSVLRTGSTEPDAWGGHARSPLALTFGIAEVLACAGFWPVVITWLYVFVAGTHISFKATDQLVKRMEAPDSGREEAQQLALTETTLRELGVEVQMLCESVLVVTSKAWGPSVSAFVLSCATATVMSVRGLMTGEVFYIVLVLAMLFGAVAAVYPLAKITSRCVDLMAALNKLRSVGLEEGMVSESIGHQITVIEAYLKGSNKGKGPGVVVLGQVIATSTLLSQALKASGALGTVVPLLVAYQSEQAQAGDGSS